MKNEFFKLLAEYLPEIDKQNITIKVTEEQKRDLFVNLHSKIDIGSIYTFANNGISTTFVFRNEEQKEIGRLTTILRD